MAGDRPRVIVPTLQEAAEVWACDAQVRVYWATEPLQAKRLAFAKYRAHKSHAGPWRRDRVALAVIWELLEWACWELAPEGAE